MYSIVAYTTKALLTIPRAKVNVERLFNKERDIISIRCSTFNSASICIVRLVKSNLDQEDKRFQAIIRVEIKAYVNIYSIRKVLTFLTNLQLLALLGKRLNLIVI